MSNHPDTHIIKRKHVIGVIVYAVLFFLLLVVANLDAVNAWLAWLLDVFRPILIGLVIAYLSNPIFRFFERKMLFHVKPSGLRRTLSLFLTYLVLFLIIAGLLLLIIPQLIASVQTFVANFDQNFDSIVSQINGFLTNLNDSMPPKEDGSPAITLLNPETLRAEIAKAWNDMIHKLQASITPGDLGFIMDIFNTTSDILLDVIFAFFVSLYLLASKEKRYAQIMKFRKAYFSDSLNSKLTYACSLADHSFGGFLKGKLLDSAIIGVLVYFVCLIFDIPYAILAAVIVGITDIVPVIGPFIGVIPTAIIILLTDPVKVIVFLIAILVIQQLDGNVIAPKILGENTGVSSLCVMIAILVMGELWGLVGMLVGVPLFATVIELVKLYLNQCLQKKGLPCDTESYGGESTEPRRKKFAKKTSGISYGGAGDLSELEQIQLRTYALARKHRILSENCDDEALTEFAGEAAQLFATVEMSSAPAEPQPQEEITPQPQPDATDVSQESNTDAFQEEPQQETTGGAQQ